MSDFNVRSGAGICNSPDPKQVRQIKATAAEQAGLTNSVRQRGVLEPLVVRPNPEREGSYLIVFGEC